MLQAQGLAEDFTKHVVGCPSGIIVCSGRAAVEAWFKVELAYLLLRSGRFNSVWLDFNYPGTGGKADLAAEAPGRLIVFELKCFVQGADSTKMKKWPAQLERLLHLVQSGEAAQGVALATYFGYPEKKTGELVTKSYAPPWSYVGSLKFYEDKPLQLVVATFSQTDHESTA